MTRLLWLADELRAWGLDVVEVTGWRDRARPGAFDPTGCLIHHTAVATRTDRLARSMADTVALMPVQAELEHALAVAAGKRGGRRWAR